MAESDPRGSICRDRDPTKAIPPALRCAGEEREQDAAVC